MEPILDETTLIPCPARRPGSRIGELARTLQALDAIGAPRVLRSVRDAADRNLDGGRGLRGWCFDPTTSKDAGRLVALRLAAQPFVDGQDGLYTAAEGERAVEASLNSKVVMGLGLAALTDGVAVLLASEERPEGEQLTVQITFLSHDGHQSDQVEVRTYARAQEVINDRVDLIRRFERALKSGIDIVSRVGEVFPSLVLGNRARDQIGRLTGAEPVFPQLVRHLRSLHEGALRWTEGEIFTPVAVTFSVESKATLDDSFLGPMRDFPTPHGFAVERWSLHTKLTGGSGARLYFRAVRAEKRPIVLVGYFGDHLPTVKHRT